MFSYEICEIFKDTFFYRIPPVAPSVSTVFFIGKIADHKMLIKLPK